MPQPVEITVKSQLQKITSDLDAISKKMTTVQKNLKTTTENIGEDVSENLDRTKKGIDGTGMMMSKVLKSLKEDFKALASVGAIGAGLKISTTMGGVVKDTVKVSDTVRKLSDVFKIATKDQAAFVGSLTKGLGKIGLGGEAASNALEGLKETQVRGAGNLTGYAVAAGQLASISGQRGQEGTIAKGLADVVQARGHNVNDPHEMQAIAEAVNRTRGATGKSATDILSNMRDLLAGMNDNQKRSMTPQGLSNMSIAASAGGPGATSFFQRYLQMNKFERAGLDALGGGSLFGKNGVNSGALRKFMTEAKSLGSGDVNAGLQIKGLSSDEAAGLKLLYDNLGLVEKATMDAAKSQKTLADSYEDGKTLGEAFVGNFNRIKSMFSDTVSGATGGLTDYFKKTGKSDGGAAAVTVGSAVAAAVLTKAGLGGIGSALGIKGAQEQLLEAKGEKVQPVRVTNAAEISGGFMGKAGGFMGKVGAAGSALGAGLAVGELLRDTDMGSKVSDAVADWLLKGLAAAGIKSAPDTQKLRPELAQKYHVKLDVNVRDKNKDLKTVSHQGSGPSMGAP